MKLNDYFASSGALTVAELRDRIGVSSDAQIRQWQHGYANRQPSPEYAVAIERETGGAVSRWDLRPSDWHLIWPELIGKKGAPRIKAGAVRAQAG
jgi:DNA-binding transcriptional regulator YdaS (Cro superfamily)